MDHVVVPFVLDRFEPEPSFREEAGVQLGRAVIEKTFTGDLEGTSRVEMLSVQTDSGGAGYVALEWVTGRLGGREGAFALLHLATMSEGGQSGTWVISPGSGTGELAGINGSARIEIAPDATHTLHLDYEL